MPSVILRYKMEGSSKRITREDLRGVLYGCALRLKVCLVMLLNPAELVDILKIYFYPTGYHMLVYVIVYVLGFDNFYL